MMVPTNLFTTKNCFNPKTTKELCIVDKITIKYEEDNSVTGVIEGVRLPDRIEKRRCKL
jgi:hypothetical protein